MLEILINFFAYSDFIRFCFIPGHITLDFEHYKKHESAKNITSSVFGNIKWPRQAGKSFFRIFSKSFLAWSHLFCSSGGKYW